MVDLTPKHLSTLKRMDLFLVIRNWCQNLISFYLGKYRDIPNLNLNNLPSFLPAADQLPDIQPYQVCTKLLKLNSFKSAGPDNIPPRILKEFAYELAEPLAYIFNRSLCSSTIPSHWKSANTSPIPKEIPAVKEENDPRPISLTACISKVLEEFVVEWILQDIGHKLAKR